MKHCVLRSTRRVFRDHDLAKFVTRARRNGFLVRYDGRTHVVVEDPASGQRVSISTTAPAAGRSRRNVEARLRRLDRYRCRHGGSESGAESAGGSACPSSRPQPHRKDTRRSASPSE